MEDEKQIRTLCNISFAEYKAVMEIDTTERITCNVLSKKMGLSPSRGSRIIDGLVRKKLLIRTPNPEDRRSFVLSLSSKGAKIKNDIERERNNCEKRDKEEAQLKQEEERVKAVLAQKPPISLKDLALKGQDLKDLGYSEGKKLGQVLKELLNLVLEKPALNQKKILIAWVKSERFPGN
ncbi:unnamed protein product [marine sediment metagenome]|uniref:HTH marR-type domain-containing protein n=2 Tax=marine sediment metagenome TaxID=412755 RepID=X0YZN8_9ZZZZ